MSNHELQYRYRAFLSYSSADVITAQKLHRRLESFRVPRECSGGWPGSERRMRPVFRDEDELAGSGVLDERLRTAIDTSYSMILLASAAAASSRYVNDEVSHYLSVHGPQRLAIVNISGGENPPLPLALRKSGQERIWIDGGQGLSRPDFVRLVAVLLGVDFDSLFRRDARRRRRLVTVWVLASILVMGSLGGAVWRAQTAGERDPARQEAAFRSFLEKDRQGELLQMGGGRNLEYSLLGSEDLNGDSLLDYFVVVTTPQFCGSGGCTTDLYLADQDKGFRLVLSGLGTSTPRSRAVKGQPREVIMTEYSVSREPIYSVFRFKEDHYSLSHYEYCDGVYFEACAGGVVITPGGPGNAQSVKRGVVIRERPNDSARAATIGAGDSVSNESPWGEAGVLGTLHKGEWALVQIWKGSAGFVRSRDLE